MAGLRPRPYKSPWSRWRPQKTPRTGKDTKSGFQKVFGGWALYIRSQACGFSYAGKWGGVGIDRAPIRLAAACIVLQLRLRRVPQPKNGHFPPFSVHYKAQRISQRLPAVSAVSCYFYAMGENDTPMGENLSVNFITKRLLRPRTHKSPWSDRFLRRMYGENFLESARISARFRRFYFLSAWIGPPGELT